MPSIATQHAVGRALALLAEYGVTQTSGLALRKAAQSIRDDVTRNKQEQLRMLRLCEQEMEALNALSKSLLAATAKAKQEREHGPAHD